LNGYWLKEQFLYIYTVSYERITYPNFSSIKPIPLKKGYRKIKKRANYRYDALNRITSAIGANTSNYNLNSVTYDKMGNILSLSRNGWQNTSTFTNKDVLTYSYYNSNVSNKLQKVLDNGNDNYGFKDGVNLTTEYTYDANANLITDANKGITSILYNYLNLPIEIKFDNSNTKKINYTYSADGAKLRKVVNDGGAITTLDYTGNGTVYENNTLQFIPHAEGYITPDGSSWRYVYQYRDHLGNIRISYQNIGTDSSPNLEIIEENNYYPFGLKMRGFNSSVSSLGNSVAQKYKFNGKEFDDSFNETLNTYDFGARNYDPALGRWMNLDPLAEQMRRHSPYNYAFNNPIYFIDPDGMAPQDIFKLTQNGIIEKVAETNSKDIIYATKENNEIDNNNYVVLSKDDVLDPKGKEQVGKVELNKPIEKADGTIVTGNYQEIEINNFNDADSLYKFLANNTANEWAHAIDERFGYDKQGNPDLINKNIVFTNGNPEVTKLDVSVQNIVYYNHSHNGPRSTGRPSPPDLEQAKQFPEALRFIYSPKYGQYRYNKNGRLNFLGEKYDYF